MYMRVGEMERERDSAINCFIVCLFPQEDTWFLKVHPLCPSSLIGYEEEQWRQGDMEYDNLPPSRLARTSPRPPLLRPQVPPNRMTPSVAA